MTMAYENKFILLGCYLECYLDINSCIQTVTRESSSFKASSGLTHIITVLHQVYYTYFLHYEQNTLK